MVKSQPWPMLFLMFTCVSSQIHITSASSNEGGRITSLPGQPKVSFKQYAGYVTIDEKQKREYFYYFVEAEATVSASKPLVLWLNGGKFM